MDDRMPNSKSVGWEDAQLKNDLSPLRLKVHKKQWARGRAAQGRPKPLGAKGA